MLFPLVCYFFGRSLYAIMCPRVVDILAVEFTPATDFQWRCREEQMTKDLDSDLLREHHQRRDEVGITHGSLQIREIGGAVKVRR